MKIPNFYQEKPWKPWVSINGGVSIDPTGSRPHVFDQLFIFRPHHVEARDKVAPAVVGN